MLRELIWLWDAKLNYERGKEAGLAGVIGLIFVFIGVYYRDKLYVALEYIGVIDLADRLGLINGEWTPLLVVIGIGYFFLLVILFLLIGLVALFTLFAIVRYFEEEGGFLQKVIKFLYTYFFLCPLSLFIVLPIMFLMNPSKFIKEQVSIQSQYNTMKKYIKDQKKLYINKNVNKTLTPEAAKTYLNRLFITGDSSFLLGYIEEEDKLYILLPSPLYFKKSSYDRLYGWQGNGTCNLEYYQPLWSVEGYKDVYGFTALEVDFITPGKDDLKIVGETSKVVFNHQLSLIVEKDYEIEIDLKSYFERLSSNSRMRSKLLHDTLVYLTEYNELIQHIAGEKKMPLLGKEPLDVINLYSARNYQIANLIYSDLESERSGIGIVNEKRF